MTDKGTNKKVTRVEGEPTQKHSTFVPTSENKGRAKQFRLFALLAWVLAIGAEVGAIFFLKQVPINMVWIIVFIVVDLAFAITGSVLWKKANRLDPASEKDKVRFFIQNQLGLIITVIAFLPLVILIFKNKEMSKKQKGIIATIAIVAMAASGIIGTDFSPPSKEQYAQQIEEVKALSGKDFVYWTKSGTHYHLYSDCHHINTSKTTGIFEGSVAQAREIKKINDLCQTCKKRIVKEKGVPLSTE